MGERIRREGRVKGQKAKERMHMGFGGGQKRDLEIKIALPASIPVHAAVASGSESRRRDVPGPRYTRVFW